MIGVMNENNDCGIRVNSGKNRGASKIVRIMLELLIEYRRNT